MTASINKDNCPDILAAIYTTAVGESLCKETSTYTSSSVLFERKPQIILSSKFFKLQAMLQEMLNLDFEALDMDVVTQVIIDRATTILQELEIAGMPIYHVSPGRGGEVLLEVKNGNYEAEVYVNVEKPDTLYLYNNEHCLFEGEYSLTNLVHYFNIKWQRNYTIMTSY